MYTLLGYSQKRGAKGMNEVGVLPLYKGIIQHDCWASYWKYDVEHAVCCAHLLRELNGVLENHPEQEWAKHFKILLVNMKKTKKFLFLTVKHMQTRIILKCTINNMLKF